MRSTLRTTLAALLLIMAGGVHTPGAPGFAAVGQDIVPPTARWIGTIATPGHPTEFTVTFWRLDSGSYAARIDIPSQGVLGLAVSDTELSDRSIRFVLTQANPDGAVVEAERTSPSTAEGTLRQAGQLVPISMMRVDVTR